MTGKTKNHGCSDEAILTGLRRGTGRSYEEAVGCLYTQCRRSIIRSLKTLGARDSEAEDVFQDAVTALADMVRYKGYNIDVPPCNYLFGIAKNIWFKIKRKKGARTEDLTDWDAPQNPEIEDFEAILEQIEQERVVGDCWEKLSDECREILGDYYFKKLSMEEIARLHGFKDLRVAKQTKYRCLKKLKEYVREHF